MKLALGSAQFGLKYGISNKEGQVEYRAAKKIVDFAYNSKIMTIDTAISYGNSEEFLGRIGVKKFQVITKLPPIPAGIEKLSVWINNQVQESLDRLKIDKIYALLVHQPNDFLGIHGNEIYKSLEKLKDENKIFKIGVSSYSPLEIGKIITRYNIDIIQLPFNLIDRRLVEKGYVNRLKDMDIEVHVRSVFLQGLLLMRRQDIPGQFSRWSHLFTKWHNWLDRTKINPVKACLSYPLSIESIDKVVIGVESYQQLKEILELNLDDTIDNLPDINSIEEKLINPSMWSNL